MSVYLFKQYSTMCFCSECTIDVYPVEMLSADETIVLKQFKQTLKGYCSAYH